MIKPLNISSVDRSQMQLANYLSAKQSSFCFAERELHVSASLTHGDGATERYLSVSGLCNKTDFVIHFNETAYEMMFGEFVPIDDIEECGLELLKPLCRELVKDEDQINFIESVDLEDIFLSEKNLKVSPSCFALDVFEPGSDTVGRVFIENTSMKRIDVLDGLKLGDAPYSPKKSIVLCRLSIGNISLSAAEFFNLEKNDVLVTNEKVSGRFLCGKLTLSEFVSYPIKIDTYKQSMQISGDFSMNTKAQKPTTIKNLMSKSAFDVNDMIPVNISFEVGSKNISLSEVSKLGKGYVFDLDTEISHMVSIKIQSNTIGYGELVDIGGKVGVRVTEIKNGSH